MFILKHNIHIFTYLTYPYLHSIMFILKLYSGVPNKSGIPIFTFHNVYIKTLLSLPLFPFEALFTFHNVYIKTSRVIIGRWDTSVFTFHNVYIKTTVDLFKRAAHIDLHSIMFILKRRRRRRLVMLYNYLHSIMFILKPT